jgi:hypothetical protein
MAAKRAFHTVLPVDRKAACQGMHLGTNSGAMRFVMGVFKHIGDQVVGG